MIMKNKSVMVLILTGMVCLLFAACGADRTTSDNTENAQTETAQTENAEKESDETQNSENQNKVAKDGAEMQTEDKTMPTRKIIQQRLPLMIQELKKTVQAKMRLVMVK